MLKTIIKRFFLGFIYEVFATNVISILFSINIGNGSYYHIAPGIMQICNTELAAVILQFFLAGILGGVFGLATVFWEIDSWSIAKQTIINFTTTTVTMLIIAYICCWMPHTIKGFLCWLSVFIVVYVIIWFICYSVYKHKINQVNKSLQERNKN